MNTVQLDQLLVHAAWLRRFATALVRDADVGADVAQRTLIAAWQNPPPDDTRPRSWLAKVAVNQMRDLRRSGGRRDVREGRATAPVEPATPEQLVGDLQIHRALAEEVTALDEPYRTTVFLHYYEGLTSADIAAREGIPAGTVRWRLKEGLDRVRRRLDERHGGDRRRWMGALVPLVPRPAVVVTSSAGGPALVNLPAPLLLLVLGALLVVAALVWGLSTMGKASPRTVETTAAVEGPGRARASLANHARTAPPRFALPSIPASPLADEAPGGDPEGLLRALLGAIEAGSYDRFAAQIGDLMKAQIGQEDFQRVSAELATQLQRGYLAESLGTVRQEKHVVHLWKLVFVGADDVLARLILEDGRAAAFTLE
jgi:RNA polymerase sigma-70 factor (ECF subfamily)